MNLATLARLHRTRLPFMGRFLATTVTTLALLTVLGATAWAQTTYTWNTAGGAWTTAANWTPTRSAPAANDILVFNNGGTYTVTSVPTQTIGQLSVSGNTAVTLDDNLGAAGTVTLSIAGGTGVDLSVASGSQLNVRPSGVTLTPIIISILTGATGSISGNMTFTAAAVCASQLLAADVGSLTINPGVTITQGQNSTGSLFGTTGSSNTVVYSSGAVFDQIASSGATGGANAFGLAAPGTKVNFALGSLWKYEITGGTPAFSGRTYNCDLEYNAPTASPSGGSAITLNGNLTIDSGVFNFGSTANPGHSIKGNILVKAGATLNFNPAAAATINLNGTSAQTITINGTFASGNNAGNFPVTFVINNASGINLATNITIGTATTTGGGLSFTSGRINTGANTLTIASGAGLTGAGAASGWVNGKLKRTIPISAGAGSLTYDVGDASNYTPVLFATSTGGSPIVLTASTTPGQHPNISTSGLDQTKDITRYYTLTTSSGTFTSANLTFNWAAGDNQAGNPSNYIAAKFDAPSTWTSLAAGSSPINSTSMTVNNVSGFSDFAIGEAAVPYTIQASAGANGSIAPSGTVNVNGGSNQSFTITPNSGYHVADVVVDGGSVGAVTSYTFTNVSANHTITASFADWTILATATGPGTIAPSGTTHYLTGANDTYTMTPNANSHVVDVVVDNVSQGPVTSYSFTNISANHTIAASFAVDTRTIQASAGANGSINPSGAVSVDYGSDQSFTISPNSCYHVLDVVVDGGSVGAVTSYTFMNVTTNHTIDASFAINTYTIESSAGPNGTIAPNGTTPLNCGDNQSYTITPDGGYSVLDVVVDGNSFGAVTSYTFNNVQANHTITASFAAGVFHIDASAGPGGTINPSGNIAVTGGSDKTFTITPDGNHVIADVVVDGNSVGAVSSYTFTNVITDHTITASFSFIVYQIESSAGPNGQIAPNGTTNVNSGDSQAYTITPDAHYQVGDVLVDGNSVGAVTSYTFTNVTANHTIAASFTIKTWQILSSAGANGTIAPNGVTTVNEGSDQAYTIAGNAHYHVADVLVDGGSVGAVTSYTFQNVTANHTISATFAIDQFAVNVTISGNGSVVKNPNQALYDYGTSVQLTATPGAGSHFDSYSGDESSTSNPFTFVVDGTKNITATFLLDVYSWNQTGSGDWQVATNWTPTRNTPHTDDVLQFNNGATTQVTNVPTQTIAQLVVTASTNATLSATAARTLTIAGAAGTDLTVDAGSTLGYTATATANAISIALSAGATGTVDGTVFITGTVAAPAAHRLTAASSGALHFRSGSLVDIDNGFGGNLFGTTSLNSVVFESGSVYEQAIGSNPFGAAAPTSVVTFQTGSLYRVLGPPAGGTQIVPSFSGRTYADFECAIPGTITSTGSADLNIDNLTVTSGTLSLGMTGAFNIHRNLLVNGTLILNPATPALVSMVGTAPQTITVNGTLSETTNETLEINNATGVSLGSDVTLAGGLQFTSGKLTTGPSAMKITSSGSVTGANQSTGWVVGNLQRNVPTSGSRLFDVGDAAFYSPISTTFHGLVGAFDLVGRADVPDHPNLAASTIDPSKSANRYWTLTPAGAVPSFTDYTAAFRFNAADLDGAANTANFIVDRYDGTWHTTTTGVRTPTSTQATGIHTGEFGAFAVGDKFFVTTATSLTSDVNPSSCGSKVNLTATVTPVGVTGTVTFYDGANPLGTAPVDANGNATLSVTTFAVGSHTLSAQYSGDNTYGPSTSPNYVQNVNTTSTTLTLGSTPNPSVCEQKVNLTATDTPAGGTGTVEFFDGANSLGTAPLDGTGHATLSVTFTVGSHSLTAQYAGDACYAGATSAPRTQVVNKAAPPLTLTSDVNPSTYGDKVNFTASVPAGSGGSVTFRDSTVVLGTAPVDGSGNATLSVSTLQAGAHTQIKASYTGDGCYLAGSTTMTQQVNRVTSTTDLQQDSGKTTFGDQVTFTAQIQPATEPGGSASGHVTFYDGANVIGTANVGANGQAILHLQYLTVGKHDISAVYDGDNNYTGNTSNTVSHEVNAVATTTTMTSDVNPAKLGEKINLSSHTDPAGATGTVTFLDGATPLGSAPVDAAGNATLSVTTLGAGKHDLTASFDDNGFYASSVSAVYSEVVIGGPNVTVTFPNGGENLLVGSDVKLIWTADGPQTITGVSLYISRDNGATYDPIALNVPNNGSFVWTVTPPGTNTGAAIVYSALFKVVATDVSNVTGEDTSDAPFSIYDLATEAVVTKLDAEPADVGVTIKWTLLNRNLFSAVTLERSPAEEGPWTAVSAESQVSGDVTTVTDRSAAAGQTYWYRLTGVTNAGAKASFGPVKAVSGAPKEFGLSSAWPNPTKGALRAQFSIARQADIRLSLMDVQGREVSVLAQGTYQAGRYEVSFDGKTGRGPIAAGMYFLRLQTPDQKFVKRVVVTQ